MPCRFAALLCIFLLGCGGAAHNVRTVAVHQEDCVYLAHRDVVEKAGGSPQGGMEIVPMSAPIPAPSTAAPPRPPPLWLHGLPGAGLGDGTPRGLLRLVPAGSAGAAVEAGIPAAELVVVGGAVIAAVGSGVLVCATANAAADGEKTPIDIADGYYGTHFSDVLGWAQGQYPPSNTPRASPKQAPIESKKKKLGRIYVTYSRYNTRTGRTYSGRTSMVVDLTQNLSLQAAMAVSIRNQNHHLDENSEPKATEFAVAQVDEYDIGGATEYSQRYNDIAYWRIRGREQQLIDFHGGAWSDTAEPYKTENAVRGVAKDNPRGRRFHDVATVLWGELHPYTGY
jgi:hypothetical protein